MDTTTNMKSLPVCSSIFPKPKLNQRFRDFLALGLDDVQQFLGYPSVCLRFLIGNLFKLTEIEMSDITHIIISCVVPPLLNAFEEFAHRYFNITPVIVGPGLKTGMPIQYDNPKEVGADRIVNAVAAYEKYHTGLVVVDFGTATTFDCVSKEGAYIGGAIAPGVTIS